MEEEKRLKLKAFLLKARRDAHYQLNHFSLNNSKQIRYEFSYKALSNIMLGLKGIHALNNITELLVEDETINRKFSLKTLKREIENTIGEIVLTEEERIDEATSKSLDALLMKLENMPYSNWTIVIPIVNLDLRIPSIQIGAVRIEICKHEMFLDFEKYVESNIDLGREMKNELLSYTRKYIGKPICISTISAIDKEQAFEIADTEIERTLNILRFYSRGTMSNDAIIYRMFIGRAGYRYKDQSIAYCFSENESEERDNFNFKFQFTGFLYPFVLDSSFRENESTPIPKTLQYSSKKRRRENTI